MFVFGHPTQPPSMEQRNLAFADTTPGASGYVGATQVNNIHTTSMGPVWGGWPSGDTWNTGYQPGMSGSIRGAGISNAPVTGYFTSVPPASNTMARRTGTPPKVPFVQSQDDREAHMKGKDFCQMYESIMTQLEFI